MKRGDRQEMAGGPRKPEPPDTTEENEARQHSNFSGRQTTSWFSKV